MKKRILSVLLIVFSLVLLVACGDKVYKVTFDTDGGSEIAAVEVPKGEAVTKPAENPTKDGFEFKYWVLKGEEDEYKFSTKVTKDITLVAIWKEAEEPPATFKVTFDSDGGSEVAAVEVEEGKKVAKPEDPTKDGYDFVEWQLDGKAYDFDAEITKAITLKAKWKAKEVEIKKFTVTFDSDGGSEVAAVEVEEGKKVAKPEDPTKDGYDFVEWQLDGKAYDFDAKVTKAITLKAKWEAYTVYQITYHLDEGNNPADAIEEFTKKDLGAVLPEPTKDGFKFDGWYDNDDFDGAKITRITKEENMVLYAKWLELGQITYVLNGGTNPTEAPSTYVIGEEVLLPVPTKQDGIFLGWYLSEDFDGEPVKKILSSESGDKTFYAKWDELITGTISYNLNDGSFFETLEQLKIELLTDYHEFLASDLPLTDFMHGVGETSGFEGPWATVDGSGWVAENLTGISIKDADDAQPYFINKTKYHAKWFEFFDLLDTLITELNSAQAGWSSPWTMSTRLHDFMTGKYFNENKAYGEAENSKDRILAVAKDIMPNGLVVKYDNFTEEFTLLTPLKEGYRFGGWYDNAEFTGDAIEKIDGTKEVKDLVLYAKWVESNHTVTFDTDGGTAIDPVILQEGEKVRKPKDPTREGYLFVEWLLEGKVYDFNQPVTEDITLVASWIRHIDDLTVDYEAKVNEDRETYYIKVTVPGIDLLESDIKSIHTHTEAGKLVDPVELGIVEGDPYLWFGVAKLDGVLYREEGLYVYKLVLVDDSEVLISFVYDKEEVTGLPDTLQADVDYKAVLNEAKETYYIKVSIKNQSLHKDNIKSIRTIKEAGELITPVNLKPDTDHVLWFGVADLSGIPSLSAPGVYAYEVVTIDDVKYVFEFNYDPQEVTNLPEVIAADIDYAATLNETRETWYIKVTPGEEKLDAESIKEIYAVMEAGTFLKDPRALTPDTDKVMWFGVAGLDGDLALKESGMYMYRVVRQDDTEFIFSVDYDADKVTGILHTIEFDFEGMEALEVEKGQLATKPKDPVKEGHDFVGWFTDKDLKAAFDWNQAINENITLYPKFALTVYSIDYQLNGGEFVYPLIEDKESLKVAFLQDFHKYLGSALDLDEFMHGTGKTSGYDGPWHKDHQNQLYAGPRPTEIDESFFISSSLYMEKWLPFFDLLDKLIYELNNTQYLWGSSTWTGRQRIGEYFREVHFKTILTVPEEYSYPHAYDVVTEIINLPLVVGETDFLGWYDNPEFTGEPITKIAKGTTGNLVLYARWEEVVEEELLLEEDFEHLEENIQYNTTEFEIDGKVWYSQEVGYYGGDQNETSSKMIRLRGANVAYLYSQDYFPYVTRLVFDAKYYNYNHSSSVMTVSYLERGQTEWVVVKTIILDDELETNVVEINKRDVRLRFDVTEKSANLDNIKVFGMNEEIKIDEVTVTFDPNNDEDIFTETISLGHEVQQPANPEKEGYNFLGWYVSNAKEPFDFMTPIVGNLTLQAKFEEKEDLTEPETFVIKSPNLGSGNNMVDGNDYADILDLNSDIFMVTANKNKSSGVGLFDDFRIYGERAEGKGSQIIFEVKEGYVITDVKIVFGSSSNEHSAQVTLGEDVYDLAKAATKNVTQEYNDLSVTLFSVLNNGSGGTSNAQIRIVSFEITVAPK